MSSLDDFIDKISKGQDTSYNDINVTTDTDIDTNTSAIRTWTEDGTATWSYDGIK